MTRRYNHVRHENGEITSQVAGWEVTYPSMCNGRLADLGFAAHLGWGGSNFVYFYADNRRVYGIALPKKAIARLERMRQDYESETK